MTWSRRQLLSVLATGVAAPAIAPLLTACGGSQSNAVRRRALTPQRGLDDITDQVRKAVSRLTTSFTAVSGYVRRSHRGRALADGTERHVDSRTHTELVLRGVHAGGWFERATSDLSSEGIDLAELQLRQRAPGTAAAATTTAQPRVIANRHHATTLTVDPRKHKPQQWLAALEKLHQRALAAGDSRVVYRGAYLLVDDSDSVYITPDAQVSQRVVRSHAGVQFIVWTGTALSSDDASRAGTMGLEAIGAVSDGALHGAARRALSLLTARGSRDFDTQVVLDPSVVALLAQHCVAPAVSAAAWHSGVIDARRRVGKRLASPLVTVVDDPTSRGLYGSYFVDDEGQPARRTTLIDKGVLRGPLTDRTSAAALQLPATANGRRSSLLEPARPQLSNLWFEPGKSTSDQLIASVNDGVLIEGGMFAQFDPRSWRLVIRVARAHEIRNGSLSGKLFANVDLVAELPALLLQVSGMSNQVEHRPVGDDIAASAGGPYMLSRAKLVGRG